MLIIICKNHLQPFINNKYNFDQIHQSFLIRIIYGEQLLFLGKVSEVSYKKC